MSNIEVGEYVRTKDGVIDKVAIDYNGKCNNPNCNYKHISCETNYYNENDIVNHSKNIIDLIEVGDYVNGHLVTYISVGSEIIVCCDYKNVSTNIYKEDIKSIVTKEMYKSIEYKVGE